MVSITFYGGVGEIGGNKIQITDGDTKVFFDFGQSFSMGAEYYTGWLSPRRINGLGDYFEFNLLPKIPGIYSKEMLSGTNLPYVEPDLDGVFLSHPHFDHVSHIAFLDPEIPIYVGAGTKIFMDAMEKTSNFANYGLHPYKLFRTGDKIAIGNLEIEPVHVDHSIPAAYGFIIHTSSGTMVYTGDLRQHGPRSDMTEDFITRAVSAEPEAIITEGTRLVETERRKNYSEKQVKTLSNDIVSKSEKLILVTHYSRDMDRLKTFYQIACENNRKLVISPKTAYLLESLLDDPNLILPDPKTDDNILVYYRRKKSGTYDEKDYFLWERRYVDKLVGYQYVHDNQDKLLMNLNFYQFTELIDIRLDGGSPFIHSMSEPFSEEDLEDEVMHSWLNHFDLGFHQLHASGHMSQEELLAMIERIKPSKIFPVHTENPQLCKSSSGVTCIIEQGKEYTL